MKQNCKNIYFSSTHSICYWSAGQLAPPQTHTIGCFNATVSGWLTFLKKNTNTTVKKKLGLEIFFDVFESPYAHQKLIP